MGRELTLKLWLGNHDKTCSKYVWVIKYSGWNLPIHVCKIANHYSIYLSSSKDWNFSDETSFSCDMTVFTSMVKILKYICGFFLLMWLYFHNFSRGIGIEYAFRIIHAVSEKNSFTNIKPAHINICLYTYVHTETKFEIVLYLGQLNCSEWVLILNAFIYQYQSWNTWWGQSS